MPKQHQAHQIANVYMPLWINQQVEKENFPVKAQVLFILHLKLAFIFNSKIKRL